MPQRHPQAAPKTGAAQLDQALLQRADVLRDNARRRAKVPWRTRMRARAQSAVALGGLVGMLPVSVALPLVTRAKRVDFPVLAPDARYALVLGAHMTKGLHLCRHLRAAGLRVIAADCRSWQQAAARWSRAIEAFVTVPDPEIEPHGYIDAVVALVEQYGPQVTITSATPTNALVDALVAERLRRHTLHWSVPPDVTALLDNKLTFSRTCRRLQLPVPEFHAVTTKQYVFALNARLPDDAPGFRLKSVAYDPVARLTDLVLPMNHATLEKHLRDFDISQERPWIAQATMQGEEYSTYALARGGRLVAYAATRACASNLRYSHVDTPEMEAFVGRLCAALRLDGQICIDFMRDKPGGRLMAIECNPRASTILTCFHDQPAFGEALCRPDTVQKTVKPLPQSRGQYWLYHELFAGVRDKRLAETWQVLQQGSDALLDSRDPWPFLAMHAAQIPTLLARRLGDGVPWRKIDLNIGKLSELGGE